MKCLVSHGKLIAGLFLLFVLSFQVYAETPASKLPVRIVLFPYREAIISARIDGNLEKLPYKSGERFEKDAVLAELDKRRFEIEFKRAKEQFNYAKEILENEKELFAKNFSSDFNLKKAEYEFNAIGNLFAEAELNLSFCTIQAPFAGRMEEISTKEFETVRAGQPLFRIIDDSQLLAVMNIPVSELNKYPIGTEIMIDLPENKLTAKGKVYEIMPRADHRSSTIQIKAVVDNSESVYTAGMTGILVDG